MRRTSSRMLSLLFLAFLGAGCQPQVLKQEIPVSTNPLGARILANGTFVGLTPTTVSLERNRDHIVTLVKESYRQEEVIVTRQYLSDRVFMKAVQSGVSSGLFHKNAALGMQSGFGSISWQEQSGEAYVLLPRAISVELISLDVSGLPAAEGGARSERRSRATAQEMTAPEPELSAGDLARAAIIAGAAVGASQAKPVEKKWETSSSVTTTTLPGGGVVTNRSSTSVGVGVNPAGLVGALDVLFK